MWEQLKRLLENNSTDELIQLLERNPTFLETTDPIFHANILHWACILKKEECARALINRFPNLCTARCVKNRLALHYACRHGLTSIATLILQSFPQQINEQDSDGMTPLLLAIREGLIEVVRFLINFPNCKLHIANIKGETALLLALKLDRLPIVELLITQLQLNIAQERLANINLTVTQQGNYHHNIEEFLKIIDIYLSLLKLGKWVIKDKNRVVAQHNNRDAALGVTLKPYWAHHSVKLDCLRRLINILEPVLQTYNEDQMQQYYDAAVKKNSRYFVDDLSDDSDADDERAVNDNNEKSERIKRYRQIKQKQSADFWERARRNTPRHAGLNDKLAAFKSKGKVLTRNDFSTLKTDIVTNNLKKRAMIPGIPVNGGRKFIAQFRGINYMADRWSTRARRYHYYVDEVGQPQFSEAALKTLPYDFYTDLQRENDYFQNSELLSRLLDTAQQIRQNFRQLTAPSLCLARTVKPKTDNYVFNSVDDYLQHCFSNGISQHLLNLRSLMERDPAGWGRRLNNPFNYAIATGDRPYHSLKYATGLKEYYEFSFDLRYNQDGKLQNCHVGKMYIILHELGEYLNSDSINRVIQTNYAGRVPVGQDIAPELETSFIGSISSGKVVYQIGVKFPSFHRDDFESVKETFLIKYGMDRSLYESFQYLIRNTPIESNEREIVIELLKEWMCAYYEVLLIDIAREKAQERQGTLVYVDYRDRETQEAGIRPFTKGETHLPSRNRVHTLQNLRWKLGQLFAQRTQGQVPAISPADLNAFIDAILANDQFMDDIAEDIEFEEISPIRNQIKNKEISEREAKRRVARTIIGENRNLFFHQERPIVLNHHFDLGNPQHLYTDYQINSLLRHLLPNIPTIQVFGAVHPFLTGHRQQENYETFSDTLVRALQSPNTTVIPINTTHERLPLNGVIPMAGTHWTGLVLYRNNNGRHEVEYIDPLNDANLANSIRNSIEEAARRAGVQVNFNFIQAPQQTTRPDDVDCGAWTVDNLVRRARREAIRTNQQITGLTLRQAHNQAYQIITTVNPQPQ